MTNEQEIMPITTWLYAAPGLPPMQVVQALELAATALCAGGTDMNVPTMPAGQPLTLEQLRGMEGQKAIIYRMKSTEPLEPGTVKMNGDVLGDNGTLAYHELYLLTWVAFSFPPARIGREAWEPCGRCEEKDCSNCAYGDDPEGRSHCKNCEGESWWRPEWTPYYDFCPWCGRPMTEHAWAKLEKRVGGVIEWQQIGAFKKV